jgi:uncharacterized protein YeaO (DUF488 family)
MGRVPGPLPEGLREKEADLESLRKKAASHTVTLVYGARDEEHNEAALLIRVLEGSLR